MNITIKHCNNITNGNIIPIFYMSGWILKFGIKLLMEEYIHYILYFRGNILQIRGKSIYLEKMKNSQVGLRVWCSRRNSNPRPLGS